jgi:hypothetical protein
MSASAKKQLFCKLWFAGLACSGLQMCCFVRRIFVCLTAPNINCPIGQKREGKNKFYQVCSNDFSKVCLSFLWIKSGRNNQVFNGFSLLRLPGC